MVKTLLRCGLSYYIAAELGATPETEEGQEITTALRAIIEFAEEHGLADSIADLIAEHQTEDSCATD